MAHQKIAALFLLISLVITHEVLAVKIKNSSKAPMTNVALSQGKDFSGPTPAVGAKLSVVINPTSIATPSVDTLAIVPAEQSDVTWLPLGRSYTKKELTDDLIFEISEDASEIITHRASPASSSSSSSSSSMPSAPGGPASVASLLDTLEAQLKEAQGTVEKLKARSR